MCILCIYIVLTNTFSQADASHFSFLSPNNIDSKEIQRRAKMITKARYFIISGLGAQLKHKTLTLSQTSGLFLLFVMDH